MTMVCTVYETYIISVPRHPRKRSLSRSEIHSSVRREKKRRSYIGTSASEAQLAGRINLVVVVLVCRSSNRSCVVCLSVCLPHSSSSSSSCPKLQRCVDDHDGMDVLAQQVQGWRVFVVFLSFSPQPYQQQQSSSAAFRSARLTYPSTHTHGREESTRC